MMKYIITIVISTLLIAACTTKNSEDGKGKTLEPPRFTPSEISFNAVPLNVGIFHPDEYAMVFYTLDGTDPTDTTKFYSEPIKIYDTTTIKAIAIRRGYKNSPIATATYTALKVANPEFNLTPDIYYEEQYLKITTETDSASIYYTINSFEPYEHEYLLFPDSLSLPVASQHYLRVQARAFKDGFMPSETVTAIYEFKMREMVYVQGGSLMGGFQYIVTLSDFYIGNYEVTQSEWEEVMASNSNGISLNPAPDIDPNKPVSGISWYETLVYCNLRSLAEGREPVYSLNGTTNTNQWGDIPTTNADSLWRNATADFSKNGYRLPTEMEWLYAARAGSFTAFLTYSGSNDIDEVAWYRYNADGQSHRVGTKKGNDSSLFDMSGNVWEWCWDWHSDDLPRTPETNPTGPTFGTFRLLKGGSYLHDETPSKIEHRAGRGNPWYRNPDWGLRVVYREQLEMRN